MDDFHEEIRDAEMPREPLPRKPPKITSLYRPRPPAMPICKKSDVKKAVRYFYKEYLARVLRNEDPLTTNLQILASKIYSLQKQEKVFKEKQATFSYKEFIRLVENHPDQEVKLYAAVCLGYFATTNFTLPPIRDISRLLPIIFILLCSQQGIPNNSNGSPAPSLLLCRLLNQAVQCNPQNAIFLLQNQVLSVLSQIPNSIDGIDLLNTLVHAIEVPPDFIPPFNALFRQYAFPTSINKNYQPVLEHTCNFFKLLITEQSPILDPSIIQEFIANHQGTPNPSLSLNIISFMLIGGFPRDQVIAYRNQCFCQYSNNSAALIGILDLSISEEIPVDPAFQQTVIACLNSEVPREVNIRCIALLLKSVDHLANFNPQLLNAYVDYLEDPDVGNGVIKLFIFLLQSQLQPQQLKALKECISNGKDTLEILSESNSEEAEQAAILLSILE